MGSMATEPLSEPIAIIGLSCKFAGDARSPEDLWRMLTDGRNVVYNSFIQVQCERLLPSGP